MAGSSAFYNSGLVDLMDGTIPLVSGSDIRAAIMLSSYTFDAAHDFVSDVSASIAAATGPRIALTSEALSINTAASPDAVEFDAADVTFTAVTNGQTVGGLVLYKYNAADAAAELLCYIAFTNTAANGGDITIQWAATGGATAGGILNIPVS